VSAVASSDSVPLRVGRRTVAVSHPGKPLFSSPEVTKLDLARYYEQVGDAMVPYLRGRPLAMETYPGGIDSKSFFVKSAPAHFPRWIPRATVPKRGGTITQALAEEPATLVFLAGQNVITPHIWLSRADRPHDPDRLIIDLDPAPQVKFTEIRAAARAVGERLRDAGLATYAMVTGSRGIHVVSPLRRGPQFTEVHRFTRALAEEMVAEDPAHLTLEWHREERGRRIYLDVNRVAYAQHVVAPYGVRARTRAPVAMPIHWDELKDARLAPDGWTVRTAPSRLEAEGDAWRGISRHARNLPRVSGTVG
jgi:bifunctional non-homologous end joining protein LigD